MFPMSNDYQTFWVFTFDASLIKAPTIFSFSISILYTIHIIIPNDRNNLVRLSNRHYDSRYKAYHWRSPLANWSLTSGRGRVAASIDCRAISLVAKWITHTQDDRFNTTRPCNTLLLYPQLSCFLFLFFFPLFCFLQPYIVCARVRVYNMHCPPSTILIDSTLVFRGSGQVRQWWIGSRYHYRRGEGEHLRLYRIVVEFSNGRYEKSSINLTPQTNLVFLRRSNLCN